MKTTGCSDHAGLMHLAEISYTEGRQYSCITRMIIKDEVHTPVQGDWIWGADRKRGRVCPGRNDTDHRDRGVLM